MLEDTEFSAPHGTMPGALMTLAGPRGTVECDHTCHRNENRKGPVRSLKLSRPPPPLRERRNRIYVPKMSGNIII